MRCFHGAPLRGLLNLLRLANDRSSARRSPESIFGLDDEWLSKNAVDILSELLFHSISTATLDDDADYVRGRPRRQKLLGKNNIFTHLPKKYHPMNLKFCA